MVNQLRPGSTPPPLLPLALNLCDKMVCGIGQRPEGNKTSVAPFHLHIKQLFVLHQGMVLDSAWIWFTMGSVVKSESGFCAGWPLAYLTLPKEGTKSLFVKLLTHSKLSGNRFISPNSPVLLILPEISGVHSTCLHYVRSVSISFCNSEALGNTSEVLATEIIPK